MILQNPRGVRGYELLGGDDFDFWKVQGNLGGESGPDNVRGPLNEGGLFVERIGKLADLLACLLYDVLQALISRDFLPLIGIRPRRMELVPHFTG